MVVVRWLAALVAMSLHGITFAQDAPENGDLSSSDVLVVEPGDGGRYWRLVSGTAARVTYPKSLASTNVEGCVAMGFVIQPDGTPAAFRVLRTGSNLPTRETRHAMASALVLNLRRRRYEPGPENPKRHPGFSYVSTSFGIDGGRGTGAEKWLEHCKIDDLGAFMRDLAGQSQVTQNPEVP